MLTRNVDERKFTKPPAGRPPRRRPARERINLWGLVGGSAGVVRGYACRTIAPEVRSLAAKESVQAFQALRRPGAFALSGALLMRPSRHAHATTTAAPAAHPPLLCAHGLSCPPPAWMHRQRPRHGRGWSCFGRQASALSPLPPPTCSDPHHFSSPVLLPACPGLFRPHH